MIKKLFKQLFNTSAIEESTTEEKKLPYLIYEDFINSNLNFDSLDKETQQILYLYIGIQCSNFVTNDYPIRVTDQDILKHLKREVNILSLEEHIYCPSKSSPKEIYLGGDTWVLDVNKLIYFRKHDRN